MSNTRKQLDPADLSTDHQTPQERFQHMMGKEGVLPDLSLGMKGKVSVCQKCTCFLNSPLGGTEDYSIMLVSLIPGCGGTHLISQYSGVMGYMTSLRPAGAT